MSEPFDFSTLITDRKQSDVSDLRSLLKKPLSIWTQDEFDRFNSALLKGAYDYTDLNRVTACMEYLDKELEKIGYKSGYTPVVVHPNTGPIYDKNTILLLHGESLTDSSFFNSQITNSGVQVSEEQNKFGGKSLYFNGSSYLEIPISAFGDITVDFWLFIKSMNIYASPFNWVDNNYRGMFMHVTESKTYQGSTSVSGQQINGEFEALALNTWYHVAIVRIGSVQKCYINGKLKNTITNVTKNSTKMYLGYIFDSPSVTLFNGYIDEFRVSNIVRWDSDFLPPNAPYVIEYSKLDPYTWYKEDSPTETEMDGYIANVKSIRSVFSEIPKNPKSPESVKNITIDVANNIETILLNINKMLENIKRTINLGWALGISDIEIYGGL